MAIKDPQIAARLKPETMAWVDECCELLDMNRAEFLRNLIEQLRDLPSDHPSEILDALQSILVDQEAERLAS
jgi:hypothetical protein